MNVAISKLGLAELQALASSIREGKLGTPFTKLSLKQVLSEGQSCEVAASLNSFVASGMTAQGLSLTLELLIEDRRKYASVDEMIELVISGPDVVEHPTRDTAIVVRDLFTYAKRSVWIAGYAVHNGRLIFEALAEKMLTEPAVQVQLLLDIRRGPADTSRNSDLLLRFKKQFRDRNWPKNCPLPPVFYFPNAMELEQSKRASLHAKCIVVDSETCFVSSANFTEAAQKKNIEVGVLLRASAVADRLQRYFHRLIDAGVVKRAW